MIENIENHMAFACECGSVHFNLLKSGLIECSGCQKRFTGWNNEAQLKAMVDRFLFWKLPKDFAPDAGISFRPTKPDGYNEPGWWPIGTNLLTADQALEMIRHMLETPNASLSGPAAEGD